MLPKQGVSRLSLCKTPIVLLHEGPWMGGCSDHVQLKCHAAGLHLLCSTAALWNLLSSLPLLNPTPCTYL